MGGNSPASSPARRRLVASAILGLGLSLLPAPRAIGQSGPTTTTTTTTTTTPVTRPSTTTTTTTEPATTVPGAGTTSTTGTTGTTATTGPTTTKPSTTVTTLVTTTSSTLPLGAGTTTPGPEPTAGPTTLPLGVPTTTTTLPLGGVGKVDNLRIWELEITQGTQNLANDMPLVTGRTTMVRAYVRSAKKTVTGVRGILGAWRGATYLGSVVASNQPIQALTSGGLRVKTDDSLYFHVPDAWTAKGVVRFTAFVYQASVDFTFANESDTDDNFRTDYVEFHPMKPLKIYMPPLHLHIDGTSKGKDNTYNLLDHLGDIVQIITGVKRLIPVAEIQVVVPQTPIYPPSHGTGAEWDITEPTAAQDGRHIVPLATVAAAKAASNLYADWKWYAMIDPSQPYTSWDNKGMVPYGVGGSASGGVAQGKMDPKVDATSNWNMVGAGTMAHELGHNGGLNHYLCSGTEAKGGGIDPNFPTPFANCTMSIPTNSGFWGFDVYYSTFPYIPEPLAISPKLSDVAPNASSPLMGYKGGKWLDPYSYCKLLNSYGVGCSAYPPPKDDSPGLKSGAPAPPAPPALIASVTQADATAFVTVGGTVRTAGGTASIIDAAVAGEATAEARAAASARYDQVKKAKVTGFVLRVEGAGGETLDRALAGIDPPPHEVTAPTSFAFSDLVEAPFAPVAVKVLKGDAVLAELRASATAPTVKVLSPNGGERLGGQVDIRWQGGDADGDRLAYDVAYSPDGGTHWKAITMGATGTSLRVAAGEFEASRTGVVRVTARDGFRTTSDVSDAAFEAPDGPPALALVLSPGDGRTFRLGDLVVLDGTASDLTDGLVANLSWRSDRDGPLGTGREVTTRNLSAGVHRITLTATDTSGGTAEMAVTITVDGTQQADVPDAAELATLETRLKAAPARSTTGGTTDGGNGSTAVTGIAIGAGLLALVAALAALRSRRRPTSTHPDPE